MVVLRPEVHTGRSIRSYARSSSPRARAACTSRRWTCSPRQPRLTWFFGDRGFEIIRTQQHPLDGEQHEAFATLLKDALRHDAMTRMTRRYDGRAALAEVARHYTLRTEARRVPPGAGKSAN